MMDDGWDYRTVCRSTDDGRRSAPTAFTYMALFLEWEQIAAGPRHRRSPLERTAGPDAIWRFAVFSLPDLDQKDGLNEADISPLEQGTLLPPPSPALAFPTLPYVHTLLTVFFSSAPMGRSAERKYLR